MRNILSFIVLLVLITSCKQTVEQEKDMTKKMKPMRLHFTLKTI